jgi:hypothetical protein
LALVSDGHLFDLAQSSYYIYCTAIAIVAFQSFLPKKQYLSTAVAEYLSSSKHLHLRPDIEICLAKHSAVLTKTFDNPHDFKVVLQDLVAICLDHVSGMMFVI